MAQKLVFTCINDGEVDKDLIRFLCNKCGANMKKVDGLYLCEECLKPGAAYECVLCNSKKVKLRILPNANQG
jgi:predicted RNA-binding Zn-ribbon protein involved in translation (DUF1610 family)